MPDDTLCPRLKAKLQKLDPLEGALYMCRSGRKCIIYDSISKRLSYPLKTRCSDTFYKLAEIDMYIWSLLQIYIWIRLRGLKAI